MKHGHKCGFGKHGFDPRDGCGFEWQHDDLCALLPSEEYERVHRCRNCGRGPWRYKYQEDTESTEASLMEFLNSLVRSVE